MAKKALISKKSIPAADAPQRKKGSYPYYLLKACLRLGTVVRDGGGDRVGVPKSVVAEGVEMDQGSSAFAQLVASAKCFGIVDGHTELTLSDLGRDYFMPTTDTASRIAELAFLSQPPTFAFIIKKFDGSILPTPGILANLLGREFGIPGSWSNRVAQIFVSTASDMGVLDQSGCLRYNAAQHRAGAASANANETEATDPTVPQKQVGTMPPNTAYRPPTPQQAQPRSGVKVWTWDQIRLETPDELTFQMWDILSKYVSILEPRNGAKEGSQSGSTERAP